MFDPALKSKRPVPTPASFTCKGTFYATSYEAQKAAIRDCLKSHKKDAVIVLDENGEVDCTVCKIKDGIVCVYGNGRVDKYKSVQTFYPDNNSDNAVTVAIVSGRIIQLLISEITMYTLQVYGPCDCEILEMVSSYMFATVEEALAIKGVIQRALLVEVSVQG